MKAMPKLAETFFSDKILSRDSPDAWDHYLDKETIDFAQISVAC